ncbi:hypothetical protein BAUCODRAFT_333086 [Baudoinia panamericana UAMH 10762]|uniref:Uncharacterized protein n=1 Tax=Baudoinia panamericana (strain UAMH 10762) TaxID=717646 RepID=M2MIC4_BAUPA|nr:uncharacterized protein BAUCODRAFT_333086 [Baudoinia panamericana UAMH 10762]EMC91008.1 hypothetical protein BAUCODRAFT_333086 [Baudoinia panamericana UAMH 10762]
MNRWIPTLFTAPRVGNGFAGVLLRTRDTSVAYQTYELPSQNNPTPSSDTCISIRLLLPCAASSALVFAQLVPAKLPSSHGIYWQRLWPTSLQCCDAIHIWRCQENASPATSLLQR